MTAMKDKHQAGFDTVIEKADAQPTYYRLPKNRRRGDALRGRHPADKLAWCANIVRRQIAFMHKRRRNRKRIHSAATVFITACNPVSALMRRNTDLSGSAAGAPAMPDDAYGDSAAIPAAAILRNINDACVTGLETSLFPSPQNDCLIRRARFRRVLRRGFCWSTRPITH